MKKNFYILLLITSWSLSLFVFGQDSKPYDFYNPHLADTDAFSFPEYQVGKDEKPLKLWATYYYLRQAKDLSGNIPLRDLNGEELGPKLSLDDWCHSALEGSVQVTSTDGEIKTYNYAGVSDDNIVDCSSIYKLKLGKTKFREAIGAYGDGFDGYILSPYRTLAADLTIYALGTVVYIPQARGAVIDTGKRKIIHDGYFYIADKGGAIKGQHVDVFIGNHTKANFFPWIKSKASGTFQAYEVKDQRIIKELDRLHMPFILPPIDIYNPQNIIFN